MQRKREITNTGHIYGSVYLSCSTPSYLGTYNNIVSLKFNTKWKNKVHRTRNVHVLWVFSSTCLKLQIMAFSHSNLRISCHPFFLGNNMLKVLILITLKTYKQSEFLKGGKYMCFISQRWILRYVSMKHLVTLGGRFKIHLFIRDQWWNSLFLGKNVNDWNLLSKSAAT